MRGGHRADLDRVAAAPQVHRPAVVDQRQVVGGAVDADAGDDVAALGDHHVARLAPQRVVLQTAEGLALADGSSSVDVDAAGDLAASSSRGRRAPARRCGRRCAAITRTTAWRVLLVGRYQVSNTASPRRIDSPCSGCSPHRR